MKLIFVRHGKAEQANSEIVDEIRQLTDEGKKRVKSIAKFLRENMQTQKMIIWSSPLLRAEQTASILAKTLKIKQLSCHESLARGDWETIEEELIRLEEEPMIFLVGHEPYLSKWLRRITGSELIIKPGTAVGVNWDKNNGNGSVCWIMSTNTKQFFANRKKTTK